MNEKGDSVDRTKLVAVNEDGNEIEPVTSSFNEPNKLKKATTEDYLSQIVKSVYLLQPFEDSDLSYLKDHLSSSQIYAFPFSYRGGVEYDNAFVIGPTAKPLWSSARKATFIS